MRQRLLNITKVSVYIGQSVCPDYLPRSLLLGRDLTIFSTTFQSLLFFICTLPLHVGPSISTLAMLSLLLAACQLHHVFPNRCGHAALLTQPLPSAVGMHINGRVAGRLLLLLHQFYTSIGVEPSIHPSLWLGVPFRSAIIIEFEMAWCYFGCLRERYLPPAKSCPPSSSICRRGGARRPRRHDGSRLPVGYCPLRGMLEPISIRRLCPSCRWQALCILCS